MSFLGNVTIGEAYSLTRFEHRNDKKVKLKFADIKKLRQLILVRLG